MSSSTPEGPSAPTGPIGSGAAPDAHEGQAGRPNGAPVENQSPQGNQSPHHTLPLPSNQPSPPGTQPYQGYPPQGDEPTFTNQPAQGNQTYQSNQPPSSQGNESPRDDQPPPPGSQPPPQSTQSPYQSAPYPTATFGQQPPPGTPPPTRSGLTWPRPRGRGIASLVAVAVVAAVVGGGVGGYVGHQTATNPASFALGTLDQPVPTANSRSQDPISMVAQHVLPSVVQLTGARGEGSGVVLSSDGLILTNAHVLGAARNGQLTAVFQNGSSAAVTEVGQDSRADLAVVRAQGVSGLTPIQLGNSDTLQVGQQVVAVGSPLGLAGTVTSGIVSALNRPVETSGEQNQGGGGLEPPDRGRGGLMDRASTTSPTSVLDAIQTDAAINPGNSGGPLVDMQGRIVGINSAIASLGSNSGGQSGSIGLGFAIPINQAKRIADELVQTGHATQAQLGVTVRDAENVATGAQLVGVEDGSPAGKAGLQSGDVVTKIGDRPVESADSLVAAVNSAAPGSNVTLTVSNGSGVSRQVPVTLGSVTAD